MPIAIVQAVAVTTTNAGPSTITLNITPNAANNLLVVTGCMMNANTLLATVSSVSDSVDGAWTVVQANSPAGTAANNQNSFIAYKICSSTAARTITCTWAGATSYYSSASTAEFSGINTTAPLDSSNTATTAATGTTVSVSNTTVTAGDVLVVAVGGNLAGSAWSSPTDWRLLWNVATAGASQDGRSVFQIGTGAASYSATFTETGGTWFPTATMVAFKAPYITPSGAWLTA